MIDTKSRGLAVTAAELNDLQDDYDLAHFASWKPWFFGQGFVQAQAAGDYVIPLAAHERYFEGTIRLTTGTNANYDGVVLLDNLTDAPNGESGVRGTATARLVSNAICNDVAAPNRITNISLRSVTMDTGTGVFQYGSAITNSTMTFTTLLAGEHRRVESGVISGLAGMYAAVITLDAPVTDSWIQVNVELHHRSV